jgi:hypothetical protein
VTQRAGESATVVAPGTATDHFESGARCGFCARAWPCAGYQSDYQAAMRARNAAQDRQWAAENLTSAAVGT